MPAYNQSWQTKGAYMTNVSAKRQMDEADCDVKCDGYIAAGRQDDDAQEQEGENNVMTNGELLSNLDKALKKVSLYLDGKLKLKTDEVFLAELECEEGEE